MLQKKSALIEDAKNKVSEARNNVSKATERLDQAFLIWSLAWDKYIVLENRPNKLQVEVIAAARAYDEMCLAWETYEKEASESKEARLTAFNAANNLYSCIRLK
ncbi:MAG: hypothetical protein PHD15_06450 [Clostridia bacterium]|nr:hypothetical protein [Clostridia bacterium]MDD4387371.1 hypothetical protein [Clostridia bacterium]